MRLWRADAAAMASRAASHNRMLPSMSVNSNVTVPEGPTIRSLCTPITPPPVRATPSLPPSACVAPGSSARRGSGSAVVVDSHGIGDRQRLAGQRVARRELGILERIVAPHRDLALGDQGPAGAADAALAGERQVGADLLGTVEDAHAGRDR